MNITVVPKLYCPIINDEVYHIDPWPYLYFIGTVVFVEHILFIYLTRN